MKLKKLLAMVLCLAMVLGTMSFSVFANEESTADVWDGTADTSWYNAEDQRTEYTITTAEQLAGLAELVSGNLTFTGVTFTLENDLDLYCEDTTESADGDPLTFRPIGDHSKDGTFEGTFDGNGKTISNLYQNGWDLGYDWYNYGSYGLFGNVNDATIKNLTITGSESYIEGGDVSCIAGSAAGTCVFENITIEDSVAATYNNGCGGIIGWSGAGKYTFKNITIAEDVTLAGLWGSFDSSIGGVVGQAEPGATYNFEKVNIACRLDIYNDCTASYDYYNYRMCGMIIGRLEETTTSDGKNYPDMSKYDINCTDVNVTIGDWANYHYCEPTPGYNNGRGMRVEAGYSYDGLPADYDHSNCTTNHMTCIYFDTLFGGDQLGVKGANEDALVILGYEGRDAIYVDDKAKDARAVAKIINGNDTSYYATLEEALAATADMSGEITITLQADATLDYRNDAYGSADTTSITINGNGHTLTLNQANSDESNIYMVNPDGVLKLTDVTVAKTGIGASDGAWNTHAINFECAVEFNDVTFTNAIALYADTTLNDVTVNEAGDYYAIWVSARGQDVTINGLTVESGRGIKIDEQYVQEGPEKVELSIDEAEFTTSKKAAIVVKSAAGAEIEAGDNIDISKVKEDTVNLVWIDEDAAKAGYTAPVTVNGEGAVVASAIATDISVSFVETENAGVYDIVLKGNNGKIYEFVGAELTFDNTSTTVGAANKTMEYAILGINGVTNAEKSIETDDEGNYKYALRLVDTAKRAVVDEITIGQVVFYGQGNINFGVSEGKVVTTEYGTNLGQYYTLDKDPETKDTLVSNDITDGKVEEVKRDVVVKVEYNHLLDGNYWKDENQNPANQMTVTIKDGFGTVSNAMDISDGEVTFNDVKLGRLTVTLEAPGFRKYVYNTTLTPGADALVLNFWNEVKRDTDESPLAEIEAGVSGETDKNFVVGDIVMDYTVDEYDLAAVTSYYGTYEIAQADADKYIKYDLNRDGNIDIIDVHYVLHTLGN